MRRTRLKTVSMLTFMALIAPFAHGAGTTVHFAVANGNWASATSWSPQQVPTAADDVIVDFTSAATVMINSSVACNSITVGGVATAQTVALTGSLSVGPGGCNINALGVVNVGLAASLTATTYSVAAVGTLTLSGGTLASGTLNNSGTFNLTGSSASTIANATVNNSGVTTWDAVSNLLLDTNSVFNNQATGVFHALSSHNIDSSTAGAAFNNNGIFDFSNPNVGAITTITSNVNFSNTHTVSIPFKNTLAIKNLASLSGGVLKGDYLLAGTLQLGSAITKLNDDIFLQSNTAAITDANGTNLLSGLTMNSGVLALSNGARLTLNGPLTSSKSVTLDSGAILTIASGNLVLTSGIMPLDTCTINVPGGIIDNQGAIIYSIATTLNCSLRNAASLKTTGLTTLNGNYSQTLTGAIQPRIFSATNYAVLAISGTATLDGLVGVIADYVPTTGDAWKFITFASHTGQFSGLTVFANGFAVSQVVNPGDITLKVGAFLGISPVISSIEPSTTVAATNTPVSFNAIAADPNGGNLVYTWDFGDGSTGSGNPVSHSFPSDANWTVMLDVFNGSVHVKESLVITTLSPNSGGAGISNIGDGQSAPNPLSGFSITLVKSDGGLCQFNIDVNALIRTTFNVSTVFDNVDGRNSTVTGLLPVFKANQSGVYVATSSAMDTSTNLVVGKARKTIGMSGAEVGAVPKVKNPPKNHGMSKTSIKGKFIFGKANAATSGSPDSVTFSGTIELPEGLDLSPNSTQQFQFSVGNIFDSIAINAKGKSVGASKLGRIKKVTLSLPHLKGTTLTAANIFAKFQVAVSQAGMSANGFDTEGITSTYAITEKRVKSVKRFVQVAMVFAGVVWQTTSPVSFTLSPKADSGTISGRSAQ